jgi:hypothetical protein
VISARKQLVSWTLLKSPSVSQLPSNVPSVSKAPTKAGKKSGKKKDTKASSKEPKTKKGKKISCENRSELESV